MPSPAPPSGPHLKKVLSHIGQQIRSRRKDLKVSAVATAESAGISRMTLYRIEQGEASVTIGAYLSVISVLGLKPKLVDVNQRSLNSKRFKLNDDTLIPLSESGNPTHPCRNSTGFCSEPNTCKHLS